MQPYDHLNSHLIYSDDAQATRAFLRDVLGWNGRVIMMIVPGADDMQLYQPTHKLA